MKRGPRLLSQSRAHKSGAFHSAPLLLVLLIAIDSAKGHDPLVHLCGDWSGHCQASTSDGYHQDQSPDRTFHTLSPYIAGPLGAETLSGSNYISTVKPVFFWDKKR
jgi:hypothetical protein